MGVAYPRIWTLGRTGANTVIAGCRAAGGPSLTRVAAGVAADPEPARLTSPQQMAAMVVAAPATRDLDPTAFSD
jgi:hypothetical protein